MKKTFKLIMCAVLCGMAGIVSSCGDTVSVKESPAPAEQSNTEYETKPEADTAEPSPKTGIDKYIDEMTLDEKIYQMFFVRPEAITGVGQAIRAGDATKAALEKYPVGGIIYFADNIQTPEQITEMISNSQSYSEIPLFIGVDEEGGKVTRISHNKEFGVKKLPAMGSIGNTNDPEEAREVAKEAGELLSRYGFNVNFAPVADVRDEGAQNEIGDRSFSSDAELAAQMTEAYVQGLTDTGLCSVLKHFPGSGSSSADSHKSYSQITKTYEELSAVDFVPFKTGIKAGADFVLLSHAAAVNLTDSGSVPSSMSQTVINDILKNELGFRGIVITDSLEMGAVTEQYGSGEAAVNCIKAGADMILMPVDIDAAYDAVMQAVRSNEISEEQIDESVKKILGKKIEKGIMSIN